MANIPIDLYYIKRSGNGSLIRNGGGYGEGQGSGSHYEISYVIRYWAVYGHGQDYGLNAKSGNCEGLGCGHAYGFYFGDSFG